MPDAGHEASELAPDATAAHTVRPYSLVRCTTSTGKFYMSRNPWIDMSDLGWGWRVQAEGQRVSPYFGMDDMDELRRWCANYTATHPGNTLDPKEAEFLAAA